MWFIKVFREREEPEEKEKLKTKSIKEWDGSFRKWEVTGPCFEMESLTWEEHAILVMVLLKRKCAFFFF